jgi:hypothetical protein
MIDRYINRLYLTEEDVFNALIKAGFLLRPEDCYGYKFDKVAIILGGIVRKKVRQETEKFLDSLADPKPDVRFPKCSKCGVGFDTDGDGDCSHCSRW